MVAFMYQLLLVVRSRFKSRARLEAENIPEEARRHDTAVGGYARVLHVAFVDRNALLRRSSDDSYRLR